MQHLISALNNKVKNITIKPKSIGIKAASDFKNVIVKAFNQALNKVGNDKMYSVVASITIFGEEGQPVHATSKPCKNHTNQTEFNNWLSHFMDRIMIIMQSLDITKLQEFDLKFNFIEIPTGAGSHATQDRTKACIFLKKSVIKITNNDNNCFFMLQLFYEMKIIHNINTSKKVDLSEMQQPMNYVKNVI